MGERRPCKAEVVGSNPICSTNPRRSSRHLERCGEALRGPETCSLTTRLGNRLKVKWLGFCVVKLIRVYGGCLGAERR